jgi:hypothetical protein
MFYAGETFLEESFPPHPFQRIRNMAFCLVVVLVDFMQTGLR